MSEKGGGMASGSTKQRINARSSTIAELVACDDFLSKMLWFKNFMEALGYPLEENILLQDNTSAILMEKNGRSCLGKRNRHMNIRYFAIKDAVDSKDIAIEYCSTDSMIADFFTKPLQGMKFFDFRKLILGM